MKTWLLFKKCTVTYLIFSPTPNDAHSPQLLSFKSPSSSDSVMAVISRGQRGRERLVLWSERYIVCSSIFSKKNNFVKRGRCSFLKLQTANKGSFLDLLLQIWCLLLATCLKLYFVDLIRMICFWFCFRIQSLQRCQKSQAFKAHNFRSPRKCLTAGLKKAVLSWTSHFALWGRNYLPGCLVNQGHLSSLVGRNCHLGKSWGFMAA